MNGLIVVEREYRIDEQRLGYREVIERYRGIEGAPWPEGPCKQFKLSCGLGMIEQLAKIVEYFEAVSKTRRCDLLFVQFVESRSPTDSAPAGFAFAGYDYGNYISEYNFFSALFNEVLLGKYDQLRSFRSKLNEKLLFNKIEDIHALKATREQLAELGGDLENVEVDEGFCEIKVFTFEKC